MNKTIEKITLKAALNTDEFLDKKAKNYLIITDILNWIALIAVFIIYVFLIRGQINFARAYCLAFLLGIVVSFIGCYRVKIKQAQILRKYVSWDKTGMQNRLDEINS